MGRQLNSRDVESHQEKSSAAWRDWATVVFGSVLGYLCLLVAVISFFNPSLLPLDLTSLVFNKNISPFSAFSRGSGHFPKPHGFKIVALVPVTYHERTAILDCYLQVRLSLSCWSHVDLTIDQEKSCPQ